MQGALRQLRAQLQSREHRGAVFACDRPHDRDAFGEGGGAGDGIGNDGRIFVRLVLVGA